jgi:hypothetical protein
MLNFASFVGGSGAGGTRSTHALTTGVEGRQTGGPRSLPCAILSAFLAVPAVKE